MKIVVKVNREEKIHRFLFVGKVGELKDSFHYARRIKEMDDAWKSGWRESYKRIKIDKGRVK